MNNAAITYIGEHVWVQNWGNIFIVLSVAASFLSAFSYFFAERTKELSWLKLGRTSFRLHVLGVFGTVGMLFWILINHYYEYSYAWKHSSNIMPMKYVFACFWGDQEGSFLLWSIWHSVIGLILQRTSKNYETGVMTMLSLVQFFLGTMLLGIVIAGSKIGSNPFILLRENPEFSSIPLFQNANYLDTLDGRGLNPLLQNYWMTIHPPTLFLGFALTVVPFIYALTGLWRKDYTGWQKPLLPWAYTGVMILGTGILMGGAWAYEALSFGGFWAWDPVENASLVPWLTLVGAAHLLLVNKARGTSVFSAVLFCIVTFILILYSTFLTRSGILGNASVHSFTDLGMQKQLLLFLLVFVFLGVSLLQVKRKISLVYAITTLVIFVSVFAFNFYPAICLTAWGSLSLILLFVSYFGGFPKDKSEENIYSREFWMFAGSLVLFLSAVTISIFTSIPIFNKLFGLNKAPFTPDKFNSWQIPFAIVLALLLGAGQFFKYKSTDKKTFFKSIRIAGLLALLFGSAASAALYFTNAWKEADGDQKIRYITYTLLMITSAFALFANTAYWIKILKGKIKSAGSSIAHIGFSLLLIGALISTSKKITLSKNSSQKSVSSLGKEFNDKKNILLTMGDTLPMGPYYISYTGREKLGINMNFKIEYFIKEANKYVRQFELFPRVQLNDRMGNTAEPDTRHFASHDIYTHVNYADPLTEQSRASGTEYGEPVNNVIHRRDSMFAGNAIILLDSVYLNKSKEEYEKNADHTIVTVVLKAFDINGKAHFCYPKFSLDSSKINPITDSIPALGLRFTLWNIHPQEGSFEIMMSEKKSNQKDFIVMEAYMFPYINILWLGCIVMAVGTGMAVWRRVVSRQ